MSGNKEARPLARSLSHLLKRAVQYSVHCYMSEGGKSGLTHRQYTVLSAVDARDGVSQTVLVRMTGIDRSTLADLVARLFEQGHLQKKQSKEDARSNSVRLTPVGRKALKAAQGSADDVDKKLLAMLGAADRKSIVEALSVFGSAMDEIDAGEPSKSERKVKLKRRVT